MISKKPALTATARNAVRGELENLYLRRFLIENLIRSMEDYRRLGNRWKSRARKVA